MTPGAFLLRVVLGFVAIVVLAMVVVTIRTVAHICGGWLDERPRS